MTQVHPLLPCPCCGEHTLSARGVFEICAVCQWEDDPLQAEHPDFAGGANMQSLNGARAAWQMKSRQDKQDTLPREAHMDRSSTNIWTEAGERLMPEITALRHAIHEEPELGLHLPKTTAKAKAALHGLPLEIRDSTSTSGFIAVLHGAANGRTVLLRGDMDALPLTEDTGLAFASQVTGAMHACGHDTHTAMLAGAAKALCANRERLAGSVMFMFQPGEEGHHGARFMLEDGIIDPLPDVAFALHVTPNVASGIFAGRAGPLLAAADRLLVTVKGRGGHASMPQDAVDPIPVACEIVTALQAMITRRVPAFDPVVLTIGRIAAGTTNNIIPEIAEIEGTIRSFSPESRAIAHEGVYRVATNIAAAHMCEAAVEIIPGFPVTVCDVASVALAKATAQNLFGDTAWQAMSSPLMGAEDFSYMLQKVPGAMVFLGATPEGGDFKSCCPLHSNRMVLDESVMARGIALHAAFAEAFLNEGFVGAP